MDCTAEQLILTTKSTAVDFDSILSACPKQICLDLCRQATKVHFLFTTTYRCEAVFNDITIFKNQAPIPTSTRRRPQVGVDEHRLLFRQTCETNSETRFSLIFVNAGDESNSL